MNNDNEREFCFDAEKDETLCDTCKHYEEHHGIPMCCGSEYEERDEYSEALELIGHLKERPCEACEYKIDGHCTKWSCIFDRFVNENIRRFREGAKE